MPDDRALGILETRGMASLVQATDAMLKAVDVTVRGRHGIGSGWVTVVVEGEVASVQTAIDIGSQEALRHGELITARVIPRPSYESIELMPHWHTVRPDRVAGPSTLGILETRGLVPLIQGTDAMVKTAPVDIEGWAYIGRGLVHSVVRGDVASVKDAVKAGGRTAEASGELYATLVIPAPSEGLGPLLPPVGDAETAPESALGVLETTGYVSVITSSDAMVKAADTVPFHRTWCEMHAAMRASSVDKMRLSIVAAIKRVLDVHDLDRLCSARRQIVGMMNRLPKHTHVTSCESIGSSVMKVGPAGLNTPSVIL